MKRTAVIGLTHSPMLIKTFSSCVLFWCCCCKYIVFLNAFFFFFPRLLPLSFFWSVTMAQPRSIQWCVDHHFTEFMTHPPFPVIQYLMAGFRRDSRYCIAVSFYNSSSGCAMFKRQKEHLFCKTFVSALLWKFNAKLLILLNIISMVTGCVDTTITTAWVTAVLRKLM